MESAGRKMNYSKCKIFYVETFTHLLVGSDVVNDRKTQSGPCKKNER